LSADLALDPAGLLELDGRMFEALERAARSRWTVLEELTAGLVELAQLHRREFLQAYGARRLPAFEKVPRPEADGFHGPPVLSAAVFAFEYGPKDAADA